ncbi:hypothetical protein ACH5RR_015452 [Cinchona calisaya]|uniref:Uncharacterized protein n=1 Tax=Cinchona calisaya TaxID=153742 RepID=A0ABD2ZYK5_9GENT
MQEEVVEPSISQPPSTEVSGISKINPPVKPKQTEVRTAKFTDFQVTSPSYSKGSSAASNSAASGKQCK